MALNLSTLTSPATSGDVLAEALTTADFLEGVPVLRNLARGSQKGGDAKQDVALNQPKALPLIDGDGYLYLPPVSGNNASTPDSSSLDITGDITIECDFIVPSLPINSERVLVAKYNTSTNNRSFQLVLNSASYVDFVISQDGTFNQAFSKSSNFSSVLSGRTRATVKATWRQSDGRLQFFIKESDGSFTQVGVDQTIAATSIYNSNQQVEIGSKNSGLSGVGDYLGVFGARIYASIDGTDKRLDVDFTSTNVRHGDTKFTCATGQVVTINKSGNDPATVIKKPVLRFDGVNDGFSGLFNQTITDGYMFAAFSVLGDGGESLARIFSANSTGGFDYQNGGFTLRRFELNHQIQVRWNGGTEITHSDVFNGERGDFLLESPLRAGDQNSLINNADADDGTCGLPNPVSSEEFGIGSNTAGDGNACIDLEYLALFPASITDAQADAVRNFINNRNNVFDLKDGFGYYFYDAQKAPVGNISSGSASWNGRIVGSDNGDTDKYATQATANDQPVSDGYVVTFADNTDHLVIPSTTQAGWQVVGTSLGTFAYRVNANAVTELNLLGNLGNASYRQAGDLYGIILLPESATGREINEAKKLLTDRGASVSATADVREAWWLRRDIVQFDGGDMSDVTNAYRAWRECTSLTSFSTELPSVTSAIQTWYYCTSLSDFRTTDISNGTNFTSAWQNCSSLTSFPADAKLGTEASNVNFTSAWQGSGLTSFSTPLPTATSVNNAWYGCTSLTSFSTELPSATTAYYAFFNCTSLTSFSSDLPLVTNVFQAWRNCTSLTSFSTELPKVNSVSYAWFGCSSLSDFSADVFTNWNPSSIPSGVFNNAWDGCTSLTAQSVENILTSIDASGKYATDTGASGGTALADAGIDIDYNVATGSLSAATTAAIDSLSGKGWQVYINGELVIPNILDLEPAAAYSLRSFDADADPNVVNVRRSSDGATSDFTASEVSDGTLTDWVNTDVDLVTPTLNNGGFEDGSTGWTLSNAAIDTSEFYAGSKSVKLTVTGGAGAFVYKANLQANSTYRVGFWAKISDASKQMRVEFGSAANKEDINFTSTNWEYKEVTKSATAVGLAFARQSGSGDYTINIDNITVTQLTADGHVTTWYDQSDNGNDSTQATASNQPKIVDGGTLVTGGIDFGAQSDAVYLEKTPFTSLLYDSLSSFVVASFNGNSGVGSAPLGLNTSPRYYMPLTRPDGIYFSYSSLEALKLSDNTTEPTSLFSAVSGASNTSAFFNGVSAGSVSSVSGNSIKIAIGYNTATAYHNGTIQEIIIYNSDQSTNRTGIENNINDHFDIYS